MSDKDPQSIGRRFVRGSKRSWDREDTHKNKRSTSYLLEGGLVKRSTGYFDMDAGTATTNVVKVRIKSRTPRGPGEVIVHQKSGAILGRTSRRFAFSGQIVSRKTPYAISDPGVMISADSKTMKIGISRRREVIDGARLYLSGSMGSATTVRIFKEKPSTVLGGLVKRSAFFDPGLDLYAPIDIDTKTSEVEAEPSDVETAIYDPDLAKRMKEARLARTLRASNWTELRRALQRDLEEKRAKALEMLGDVVTAVDLYDGHLAEVEVTASSFVTHGVRLRLRAPWVHHLRVTDYAAVGPTLFERSLLRGVQSLELAEQGLTDEDVIALARSPHIAGLRWLELGGNALTERSHEALALYPSMAQLVYVGLDDNTAPSPVDQVGDDVIDGAIVESFTTRAGRALERKAKRRLRWLHAPERFPWSYPPTPEDVATTG